MKLYIEGDGTPIGSRLYLIDDDGSKLDITTKVSSFMIKHQAGESPKALVEFVDPQFDITSELKKAQNEE